MSDTLTQEQQDAARDETAKKKAKADAEKARKADIKHAKEIFAERGADKFVADMKFDSTQRERTLNAPKGLRGKAFAEFVETGEGTKGQTQRARNRGEGAMAVPKGSNNGGERKPRASKDPEAKALADAARELAEKAGSRSAWATRDARDLLSNYEIVLVDNKTMTAKRKKGDTVEISRPALKKYVAGYAEKTAAPAELRDALRTLKFESDNAGRYLATFLLARAGQLEA